ncbi:ATP-binding protein [Algoriphagus sp. 4150]|uniref:ATP-binding protein n=1 Tax=Algoriphagus sp. 4150 TaxID=2817756 RepID=UPI00286CCA45|nr:ATP-binding protein [Algoriphagus sp. 4150]
MSSAPIVRTIIPSIKERLFRNKAILLLGPRQVGKSTLCETMLAEIADPRLYLNGDEADVRSELTDVSAARLKSILGDNKILFIDEAQRIPGIGLTLKIIVDQLKDIQVVATGSSAFDLANLSNEPLTGRKFEFFLYPLSFGEMVNHHGLLAEKRMIEHRMIYGCYPEIVTNPGEEMELLKLLAGSYLYKDLLMLEQIKKPVLLEKLLKALALQLGSEVNYHELAQIVGADKVTVEKYIDLLEKAFVIFRVPAYNRNVRTELKKGKKIYFYDCGIRNAILGNFNQLINRTDSGALWENYFLVERMKYQAYKNVDAKYYFWRTTAQQEIDFIEEVEGQMIAIECKWSDKSKVRFSTTFTDAYPESKLEVLTPKNFEGMLGYHL